MMFPGVRFVHGGAGLLARWVLPHPPGVFFSRLLLTGATAAFTHGGVMNNAINKNDTLRNSIRSFIRDIRECRNDASIPMLLGQGYTIAVKGSTSCIARVEGGLNFSGTWNRSSSYWDKAGAEKVAANMRSAKLPFEIEVVHRNVVRDRTLATAKEMLCFLWDKRNVTFA